MNLKHFGRKISRRDYLKGTAGGILSLALLGKVGLSAQAAPVTDNLRSDDSTPAGSSVAWTQLQTSGSKIAEVTIDGLKTDVFAPFGSSGIGGAGAVEKVIMYENTDAYDAGSVIELGESIDEYDFIEITTFNTRDGLTSYNRSELVSVENFKRMGEDTDLGSLYSGGYSTRCSIISYVDGTHIKVNTLQSENGTAYAPLIRRIEAIRLVGDAGYTETILYEGTANETDFSTQHTLNDSLDNYDTLCVVFTSEECQNGDAAFIMYNYPVSEIKSKIGSDGQAVINQPFWGQRFTLIKFLDTLNSFSVAMYGNGGESAYYRMYVAKIVGVKGSSFGRNDSSGSGGTSVSWNQIQTDGDKIAEVTINGVVTDIFAPSGSNDTGGVGGNYAKTVLYDYREDNGGAICYDTTPQTLRDDIENYDLLFLEFVSASGDLTNANWSATSETVLNVDLLTNGYNPNYVNYTSFGERSSRHYIKGREFATTIRNFAYTNGLVRMVGIRLNSGINEHVYSTEEAVIGTWVDGRPIYRKVFVGSSDDIDITDLNVDVVINSIAYGTYAGGYKLCTTGSNQVQSREVFIQDNHLKMCHSSFDIQHIILEYVKAAH